MKNDMIPLVGIPTLVYRKGLNQLRSWNQMGLTENRVSRNLVVYHHVPRKIVSWGFSTPFVQTNPYILQENEAPQHFSDREIVHAIIGGWHHRFRGLSDK